MARGGVSITRPGVSIMVIVGGPNKWLPPPRRRLRPATFNGQYGILMQNFSNDWNKSATSGVAARSGKSAPRRPLPKQAALAGLLLLPLLSGVAMAAGAANPLADKVRDANARFADVAQAKAEGY